jgi:hypothetical protein
VKELILSVGGGEADTAWRVCGAMELTRLVEAGLCLRPHAVAVRELADTRVIGGGRGGDAAERGRESGVRRELTFAQLNAAAQRLSDALDAAGVKQSVSHPSTPPLDHVPPFIKLPLG